MRAAFSDDGFGSYSLVAAKDAVAPTPPTPIDPPTPDPGPAPGPPPEPQPTNWLKLISELIAAFIAAWGRRPTAAERAEIIAHATEIYKQN